MIYDMLSGILAAPNNGYDEKYDITSVDYGLIKEKAVTKYGDIHISGDPELRS